VILRSVFYSREFKMIGSNKPQPMWPPTIKAYDYLNGLAPRDWAWEGLRRNPVYQADAETFEGRETRTLGDGALLTRMQEASPRVTPDRVASGRSVGALLLSLTPPGPRSKRVLSGFRLGGHRLCRPSPIMWTHRLLTTQPYTFRPSPRSSMS
jgi:hypothetical protein